MSQARPSAAHRRAAPARDWAVARPPPAPAPIPHRLRPHCRVPARSRARQHCRQPAISCGLARPTVVRSSGLVPAPPALRAAPAQQAPDRRPTGASQPPVSASDSSCHNAADLTPVLSPKSSLAQTTFVPSRKAELQLPLGGTRLPQNSLYGPACLNSVSPTTVAEIDDATTATVVGDGGGWPRHVFCCISGWVGVFSLDIDWRCGVRRSGGPIAGRSPVGRPLCPIARCIRGRRCDVAGGSVRRSRCPVTWCPIIWRPITRRAPTP